MPRREPDQDCRVDDRAAEFVLRSNNSPRLGICAAEHCRDAAESIARSSEPEFFDENADDWLLPAALSVNIHFVPLSGNSTC